MNTACEYCIFSTKNNGKQVGCRLNRLDKFKEMNQVEQDENGHYIIKNFCNTCRNVYWDEWNENPSDYPVLVEKIKEEVKVKFDALFDIEKATEKQIVSLIKKLNKPPYAEYLNKIVLFGEMNEKRLELGKLCNKQVLLVLNESKDKFTQSAKHVHITLADYLVFLAPGVKFDFDMSNINYKLNEELKPIMYQNKPSHFLVSTFFYKLHIRCDNPIQYIISGYNEYGKPIS